MYICPTGTFCENEWKTTRKLLKWRARSVTFVDLFSKTLFWITYKSLLDQNCPQIHCHYDLLLTLLQNNCILLLQWDELQNATNWISWNMHASRNTNYTLPHTTFVSRCMQTVSETWVETKYYNFIYFFDYTQLGVTKNVCILSWHLLMNEKWRCQSLYVCMLHYAKQMDYFLILIDASS